MCWQKSWSKKYSKKLARKRWLKLGQTNEPEKSWQKRLLKKFWPKKAAKKSWPKKNWPEKAHK